MRAIRSQGLWDAGAIALAVSLLLGPLFMATSLPKIRVVDPLNLLALAVQCWILYRQVTVMRQQAEISRRQMTIAEEPVLFAQNFAFNNVVGSENGPLRPNATYDLRAIGKTPAVLRARYRRFEIADSLPRAPDRSLAWDPVYTVLDGSTTYHDAVLAEDGSDIVEARRRRMQWFVVAVWVYEDVWGQQHDYAFCFHSGLRGDASMPYGGDAYNYRRLRKAEDRL